MKILLMILSLCFVCTVGHADSKQEADKFIKLGLEKIFAYNLNGAIEDLKKAVDADPRSDFAYQMLALCSSKTKKYDDALRYIQKAIEVKPDNPAARLDMAFYYGLLRQNNEAIRILQEVTKSSISTFGLFVAYRQLGQVYTAAKNMPKALEAYKSAAILQPLDTDLFAKIMDNLIAQEKYQEASDYLHNVDPAIANDPVVLLNKQILSINLKRIEESKKNGE